jgi:DNA (cytosine-5)-methyltransferase 1
LGAKKVSKRTVVDLFAGVGGLSLGFEELGFDLVFANEKDTAAARTLRRNHPGVLVDESSIEDLSPNKLIELGQLPSHVDVLVGGVPCQAFSMAGIRIRTAQKDLLDERIYLFRHFLKFAEALKPKYVIIENVRGITSMLNGQVLEEIFSSLQKLGYQVEWRYLNAADFGAPQLRIRTVIIAALRDLPIVFPAATFDSDNYKTVGEALKDLPLANHQPRPLSGIALERVRLLKQGQNWTNLPVELQTKSIHSGAYGRLSLDKPARTLTTRFDTPSVGYVTHPTENRCLTVREGARIQGFPDDFIFEGTTMQQYRQVGNAVSPFMSRAIAKQISISLDRIE